MRKITLTILFIAAVAAAWAQKPDKKTAKLEKQLVGTFVEVPAGHYSIIIGKDTTWVTFAAFRMLATEVSNASYNLFLDDLKAQGRMADYEKAKIDTTRAMPDLPPVYYTHPAYAQSPVSCVSHEGAILFCQWLTEKIGGGIWEYTLPLEEQWKYAARGANSLHHFSTYSMDSPYLTNHNGWPLYTYLRVGDECITRKDGQLVVLEPERRIVRNPIAEKDNPLYNHWHPTHVFSNHPNNLGLYNMCGNVAEMVAERGVAFGGSFLDPGYDIRIDSEKPYNGPSPLIGFRVIAVRKKH